MADKFDTLLERLAQSVADDYEEARTNATAGNPQRAGHEGEGTWTRILRDWGPGWPVVTRKYIVGPGGSSNEVDVVILRPDYPTHLHHEPSVLSSGVAAAFSSKTTARRADVFEAVTQKRQLLAAAGPAGSRSPREILQGPSPSGFWRTEWMPKEIEPNRRTGSSSGTRRRPQTLPIQARNSTSCW